MLKVSGRLMTLESFKRKQERPKLTKKQRKRLHQRTKERRRTSKARGILAKLPPVTLERTSRPFCVFGANGDCAAPAVSLGGEHSIYALIDPRDMTVRYVGKSTDPKRRLAEHTANKMSARDVGPWLQELRDAGLAPIMEILDRASAIEWERAEQYWIGFYSQRGCLLNTEVGGRGYLHAYRKRVRWAKRQLG